MKTYKSLVLLFCIPLFAFSVMHKYYLSVTQVEYVEDKQSVQIITRIFLDDFENLLQQRYNEAIVLEEHEEMVSTNEYIELYLKGKINIKINGEAADIKYIGKEYDLDLLKVYLEIEDVASINSFEISNSVLFDLFEGQQNIIKTNINSKKKSFILVAQKNREVLNFN
ncbi:DUF6702 family protein [Seonamhaeicola sp. ML3]|uniref:DUF6702 family protein n=1 Tax=Seonamhaeicola sp. ML3 TaxID=2937786 RepID=UPI00200C98E5|nr:DUF6702 family protein [Seonamhaeicola sp. ML3]